MTCATTSAFATTPLLAVAMLLGLAAPSAAGGFQFGRLDPGRADETGFRHAREAFDCAFRDTFTTADLDTIEDDTTAGQNLLTTYACQSWTESGPEHVYRLEVADTVEFSARLADLAGGADLDLVLLGACDTDDCLAQVNTGFTAVLDPGDYVLIVDGFQGSAGAYTLLMAAKTPGVPDEICAEGGAEPVAAPDSGFSTESNLFGQPDLIQAYPGCSDLWHLAGEVWYAVTVPAAASDAYRRVTITASAADPSLDLALWVFDGCGETALCLDFADDGTGGETESVVLENQGDSPRILLLAVDAFRPPTTLLTGGFGLQFTVAVPAERRSLGAVRALFR